MTNCAIANEISIYCDEPEQTTANEYFQTLLKNGEIYIGNAQYSFYEITDLIDIEYLRQAAQESVSTDGHALERLYINTIAEIMI